MTDDTNLSLTVAELSAMRDAFEVALDMDDDEALRYHGQDPAVVTSLGHKLERAWKVAHGAEGALVRLREACGYGPDDYEGTSVDALIAYKDALEDAYGSLLERLQGDVSTPGLSGADVFADVCAILESAGVTVWGYDDPVNPHA